MLWDNEKSSRGDAVWHHDIVDSFRVDTSNKGILVAEKIGQRSCDGTTERNLDQRVAWRALLNVNLEAEAMHALTVQEEDCQRPARFSNS